MTRPMQSEDTVRAVLAFYFAEADRVQRIVPFSAQSGWSGSRLWQIELQGGALLCLRQWPEGHPSLDRLRLIHEVLDRVSAQGLTIVPVPLRSRLKSTFVEHTGRRWELCRWLPGRANFLENPSEVRLKAAMRALGTFHTFAAEGLAPLVCPAPCLLEREQQIQGLLAGEIDHLSGAVAEGGPDGEVDEVCRSICPLARERLIALQSDIARAAAQKWSLQPAIRDIHHEHVLFGGDEVTGIIDFGAMRVDSPLTDVARLIGSLVQDRQAARRTALAAYSELRPLASEESAVIELLDVTGVALGGLNWIRWLYAERRDMGPLPPIKRRLQAIRERLASGFDLAGPW